MSLRVRAPCTLKSRWENNLQQTTHNKHPVRPADRQSDTQSDSLMFLYRRQFCDVPMQGPHCRPCTPASLSLFRQSAKPRARCLAGAFGDGRKRDPVSRTITVVRH